VRVARGDELADCVGEDVGVCCGLESGLAGYEGGRETESGKGEEGESQFHDDCERWCSERGIKW
jgi:hypothetical protein